MCGNEVASTARRVDFRSMPRIGLEFAERQALD
jgi:hypothetical protein